MADGAKKKRIMSSEELSSFCDQIALMLSSGMTLRDGIEMLAEDEMKGNEKVHPYTNLYKVVDETGSLYVAMKENEEDWPSYMIEMVDIGELCLAVRLTDILSRVVGQHVGRRDESEGEVTFLDVETELHVDIVFERLELREVCLLILEDLFEDE